MLESTSLFRLVHLLDVLAAVGGIIRDTLGHVAPVILRHEIYVTASVLGACAYTALNALGSGRFVAMTAGFLVTFGVRGLAIRYGWSLPIFREPVTRDHGKRNRQDSA